MAIHPDLPGLTQRQGYTTSLDKYTQLQRKCLIFTFMSIFLASISHAGPHSRGHNAILFNSSLLSLPVNCETSVCTYKEKINENNKHFPQV